jgi:hypothetical protein
VIGGQLTPFLRPSFPPNRSNNNIDIAIFYNVVERSGNYVFEEDTPPTALRKRVVSYALGEYTIFAESLVVGTSKRAHSIASSNGSCPF